MRQRYLPLLVFSVALTVAEGVVAAQPFDSCPSQAFLVQDTVPRIYGVDLATGYVSLLADNLGTSDRFNGTGFNYDDALIYGWSYEHRTLGRIGSDFQLEPIALSPPLDDNYFVGDVSIFSNRKSQPRVASVSSCGSCRWPTHSERPWCRTSGGRMC